MAKILLFHFTTKRALSGILKDRLISPTRVVQPNGSVLNNAGVSLTSDTDPSGHGLPDGRVITSEQAKGLPRYVRSGKKKLSEDATEYRIDLELDDQDPLLVYAPTFYANAAPMVLEVLEGKGYFPIDSIPPNHELKKVIDDIANGSLLGKSKTWWYYLGTIALPDTLVIFQRDDKGDFLRYQNSTA